MRKIIVFEHFTLGVIQGPGRLDEDTSGGFDRGGWIAPYGDEAVKYVASRSLGSGPWPATVVLNDIATDVGTLRGQPGRDLHVWGSSKLVQTLFAHDLVDELFLMVYPVVLGQGKRLFATQPLTFGPTKTVVTGRGVVVTHYQRARVSEEGWS